MAAGPGIWRHCFSLLSFSLHTHPSGPTSPPRGGTQQGRAAWERGSVTAGHAACLPARSRLLRRPQWRGDYISQHGGVGLLHCPHPSQGSPVPPALPHGRRRWWDGIPAVSRLHPGYWFPAAVACPSCPSPSELLMGMVPSTPQAVQTDRQPRQGTLLLGMAAPLFQSRGTTCTVPRAACAACTAAPARSLPCPARGGEQQQGRGEGRFCASPFSNSSCLTFGHGSCLDVATNALQLLLGSRQHGEGSGHQQPPRKEESPSLPPTSHPIFGPSEIIPDLFSAP